jgi:hypothetical protein
VGLRVCLLVRNSIPDINHRRHDIKLFPYRIRMITALRHSRHLSTSAPHHIRHIVISQHVRRLPCRVRMPEKVISIDAIHGPTLMVCSMHERGGRDRDCPSTMCHMTFFCSIETDRRPVGRRLGSESDAQHHARTRSLSCDNARVGWPCGMWNRL